jgi:hypothetical protein
MASLNFEETQKFTQKWLWALIIVVFIVSVVLPLWYLIELSPDQKDKTGEILTGLIIGLVVNGLVIFLLLTFKLETRIGRSGIQYRFMPLIWSWKLIEKREIESYEVCKYSPLGDYGGWGIRYGLKGKALNVRGNQGLKLKFKNGKNLLIGTQRPDELRRVMQQLFEESTD